MCSGEYGGSNIQRRGERQLTIEHDSSSLLEGWKRSQPAATGHGPELQIRASPRHPKSYF